MPHTLRPLAGFSLTVALSLLLVAPVYAQSQVEALAGFELDLSSSEEIVSGETFSADADYLKTAGKPEWPPFDVIVPMAGNGEYDSRVVEAPVTGLLKFVFVTPGGGFIESVSLSAASMPIAELDKRLEYFATVLRTEVVPGLVDGKSEATSANTRPTKLGDTDAVELFGSYKDATYGTIHWRLVGLPHPDREEGFVALVQVAETAVPITSPEDYPATLTGRLLETFSFR